MRLLPAAPMPPRRPVVRRHHGDEVVDEYAWLADRDDPVVLAHLEQENRYAEAVTESLEPLRRRIVAEIRARTQETDLSVPVAYRSWWYYSRTVEGQQYPLHCRVPVVPGAGRPRVDDPTAHHGAQAGGLPGEQVLLDGNAEAAGAEYFALGASEVSPDQTRLAYLVDLAGDERYRLRVKDIESGALVDEAVTGTGYGLVWSLDGLTLFYTRVDAAWRPHQVWRHRVGTPARDDVLVFQEDDERFWTGLTSSRDERLLVIQVASKSTSEVWLLDLAHPDQPAWVVAPRQEGLEYDVEPAGDGLLIVHNAVHRDFELAWAPLTTSAGSSVSDWSTVVAPGPGERIVAADAFAGHVLVSMRRDGLTGLRVLPRRPGAPGWFEPGWDIPVDEPLFTLHLGDNPQWQTTSLQLIRESFVTPRTVLEIDVGTRQQSVLKRQPVLAGFDPADYVQRRIWATAADGVRIPVSVLSRSDVVPDGSAPGLLYGYGAYEMSLDPWFSVPRLSLLDRGVVLAFAHVRGGGEFGRSWYEQGRLDAKKTSFTDLLAVAGHLLDAGWVGPARLGLQGGSAGGLLVGATLNLTPDLFRVVWAEVPFVDTLTTILDPSLPLTVPEWEEWGNPLANPQVYRYLKEYAPYENVVTAAYPAVLATTSLNDTRVGYSEPAKWVARLRAATTSDPHQRPVLLRTEMVAGHGGRSGRYAAWDQWAWEAAFVLDQLDAGALPKRRPASTGTVWTGPQ